MNWQKATVAVFLLVILNLIQSAYSVPVSGGTNDNPVFVPQIGHNNSVESIVFSRDGKYIVSGSTDKTVKVWKSDGTLIRTIPVQSGQVYAVAISPDGQFIVSASSGKILELWRTDGTLVRTFTGHSDELYSVSFSPDGQYIVSGSNDKSLRLWKTDGTCIRTFTGHSSGVFSVAFSPDGGYIASGSYNVKIWKNDGTLIRTLEGYANQVSALAFSPDGNFLVTGSYDKTVKIWKTDGTLVRSCTGHTDYVKSVAFSHDGQYFASGSWDGTIRLWKKDGTPVKTFSKESGWVIALAFSPDGQYIVSGSNYHAIRLWKIDGTLVNTFSGKTSRVQSVAASPDGKFFVTGFYDASLKLWKKDGTLVRTFKDQNAKGVEMFEVAAFSPDGQYIVSGNSTGRLRLWKPDGTLVRAFTQGHLDPITSVAFSPDGQYLLSGASDSTPMLWKTDGTLVRTFTGHKTIIWSVAFSPDGKYIIAGASDDTFNLWKVDGTLIRTFNTYSGNGWHKCVWSVAFSPDGRHIASVSNDKTVSLWKTDGTLVRTFTGHGMVIRSLAFSPDGQYIASGSDDATIKLWKTSGTLVKTYSGHDGMVKSVIFSPDGTHLISGSYDATARMWDIRTGRWVALLTNKSGTEWLNFTDDGFWDGSVNSGELVAMIRGMESWRIDQFAARNNRPDIILQRLGNADKDAIDLFRHQYLKRLNKMGLSESQITADYHVPTADIIKTEQNGKTVALTFALADDAYSLIRYNIWINDVPIYGAYGRDIRRKTATLTETIELTGGLNKIEVSCRNEKGAESYRSFAYLPYEGKPKGNLYFIGFGVSGYKDPSLRLQYAAKDVKDLAGLFNKMKNRFENVYVKTYLDGQVTVAAIKQAKAFFNEASAGDTAVLFISGHGIHDRDDSATYYYITSETDIADLSGTAANFDLIEDLLQGIAPRNKLFLMDTCDSGEMEGNVRAVYTADAKSKGLVPRAIVTGKGLAVKSTARPLLYEKDRYIFNDLVRRSGAIVLSSCRGGEFSYESAEWQNGLFTFVLKKGLSGGADADGDGAITTDELRAYVISQVPALWGNLQHPTVDRDNLFQKFRFGVAK